MAVETCNEEVYEAVSRKLGVSKAKVKEVANIQSLFTVKVMQEGLFNGVRWLFLGKIVPKMSVLYYMNRRKGL